MVDSSVNKCYNFCQISFCWVSPSFGLFHRYTLLCEKIPVKKTKRPDRNLPFCQGRIKLSAVPPCFTTRVVHLWDTSISPTTDVCLTLRNTKHKAVVPHPQRSICRSVSHPTLSAVGSLYSPMIDVISASSVYDALL